MQKTLKAISSTMLRPAAHLTGFVEGTLVRLWNHTRLAVLIDGPLDSTVVVLGIPEIQGTGNIQLGKNLFLYPGLYLETQCEGKIDLGDDVVISRGAHIVSFSNVTVGSGSMIGEYASIRDANHRFGDGVRVRESGHEARPISIGSPPCWHRSGRQLSYRSQRRRLAKCSVQHRRGGCTGAANPKD
jgi:hypothetical protein